MGSTRAAASVSGSLQWFVTMVRRTTRSTLFEARAWCKFKCGTATQPVHAQPIHAPIRTQLIRRSAHTQRQRSHLVERSVLHPCDYVRDGILKPYLRISQNRPGCSRSFPEFYFSGFLHPRVSELWLPLAPFGNHFGLILAAWDSHLASPGEGCRNVSEIPRFLAPFYLDFGTKNH